MTKMIEASDQNVCLLAYQAFRAELSNWKNFGLFWQISLCDAVSILYHNIYDFNLLSIKYGIKLSSQLILN